MRVPAVPVLFLVLLASGVLPAQLVTSPAIRAGERVRVTGPAVGSQSTRVANVLGLHGDTLYLRGDGAEAGGAPVEVPMTGLTRLEVSAGITRHTWLAAGLGALAGGVIGVLTAGDGSTILPGAAATGNAGEARSLDRTASAFSGAVLGALAGGLIGHFWKAEHWYALPLPRETGNGRRAP